MQRWLRFYKADVDRLSEVLNIPQVLITYSRSEFDHIEAFCIFLKQRKTLANHVEVLGAKYANMLWLLKHPKRILIKQLIKDLGLQTTF